MNEDDKFSRPLYINLLGNHTFKIMLIERVGHLMVIYTHTKDDKDRVHWKLSEICNREELRRLTSR